MGIKSTVPDQGDLYFRARKDGAAQALTSGTAASITWNTVEANVGGFRGAGGAAFSAPWTTFQVPISGVYHVSIMGVFALSTGTTRRIINILDNTTAATLDRQSSTPAIPAGVDTNVILEGEFDLLAGHDYIVRARQDDGVNRNFDTNSNFSLRYLRPLAT